MTEIRVALDAKARLGEGPVWCPREQALYWVDSMEPAMKRFDPAKGGTKSWTVPDLIGSFALRERGGAVLALRRGFYTLDFATGETRPIAEPEVGSENRFNDGKCDRRGRFWAGSMHFAGLPRKPLGSLYRLDPGLSVRKMETGIRTSNGIGWSPDDRTMYYTDTRAQCVWAYDFDLPSGEIRNRRTLADVPEATGYPDGLTVDAEGFIWSVNWGGSRVVRYAPDGRIERTVMLPVTKPTSCSFGGADLRTLYVTSARDGLDAAQLAKEPLAGAILAFEPGVTGLPEPRFAG